MNKAEQTVADRSSQEKEIMKKTILEEAQAIKEKIPTRYDLTVGDIVELMEMIKTGVDGTMDALAAAFKVGFIRGNHCTINRKMKKI